MNRRAPQGVRLFFVKSSKDFLSHFHSLNTFVFKAGTNCVIFDTSSPAIACRVDFGGKQMKHTNLTRRLTAAIVALCMAFTLCAPALAEAPGLPTLAAASPETENDGVAPAQVNLAAAAGNSYTVQAGETVELTGVPATGFELTILTEAGKTTSVTLNNVTIDNSVTGVWTNAVVETSTAGLPGLRVTGNGDLNLYLVGTSTLKGGALCAGLQKENTGTLTIDGTGTLNATGGSAAAGVGSGSDQGLSGLIIADGTINAEGGWAGAGIGSGHQGKVEGLTISDGIITAVGGSDAAAIGSGIDGEAENISITGGTVTAQCGNYGACIGTGNLDGHSGKAVIDDVSILDSITFLNSDGRTAGPVEICTSNFPDSNFCKYLKENHATYRYHPDSNVFGNYFSEADRQGLTDIDCSNCSISDLTGIAFFPNLEKLNCSQNSISSLDLQRNAKTNYLDCSSNNLSSLDVKQNTALEYLDCSSNYISTLNVSTLINLKTLDCSNNDFNFQGYKFGDDVYNATPGELNVTGCTALEVLDCSGNPDLDKIDVTGNPNLSVLKCQLTNITALNVSQNPLLTYLDCRDCNLKELDVTGNPLLETLAVSKTDASDLWSNYYPPESGLSYSFSNELTTLDVSNNHALKELHCDRNRLTSMNVKAENNPVLETMTCEGNRYEITTDKYGRYNLRDLPMHFLTNGYFEEPKADAWSDNVTVSHEVPNVKDALIIPEGVDTFTYTYQCVDETNEERTFLFTIDVIRSDSETPTPDPSAPEPAPKPDPGTDPDPDGPSGGDEPAGSDDSSGIAGAIVAGTVIGGAAIWGGYEIATRTILHNWLPAGALIPSTRGELALLVWENKDKPEPENEPCFEDIDSEEDEDLAKAAQWCVEQEYLHTCEDDDGNIYFKPAHWVPKFKVLEVWYKAFRSE